MKIEAKKTKRYPPDGTSRLAGGHVQRLVLEAEGYHDATILAALADRLSRAVRWRITTNTITIGGEKANKKEPR